MYAKKTKQWPAALIEGFQACDIVESEMSLPVAGGDAP
jgi:hypothetical protein